MKAIKFVLILFLSTFFLFLINCSKKEADNPFDSDCPKEIFTPSDFTGQQQGIEIILTWPQVDATISGFVINRSENDGEKSELARVDKTVTSWKDNKIVGGKKYGYQLFAFAGANLSNPKEVIVNTPVSAASITTVLAASNITPTSAVLGGNVTNDGGAAITERGICYNILSNPTIANSKSIMGTGTGPFSSTVSGLLVNTKYYVRAYAKNSYGTSYGAEISFTTAQIIGAIVSTTAASTVGPTSAILGGNVTSDGNSTVTESGVCYGLTQNPTTSNTKLAMGSGTGAFSNTVTGLSSGTIYYVRAYAINSIGTSYGAQVTFTTLTLQPPTVTTTDVANVGTTSAVLGGTVTNDGNVTVTERGICYSTSQNPTIDDTILAIGSGTGAFSNTVTDLTELTTYFVRAYATNSLGTSYGAQITFTTSKVALATVITADATSISSASAVLGGNVTSDGNATVTERGFCYSLTQNPTVADTKVITGSGTGVFSNTITGLVSNTTYYVRAYAINSQGTAYGAQVNFTTTLVNLATVTTAAASTIGSTTVVLGGSVTSDGGVTVTERGVCYSLATNPTTANTKVIIGNGTGVFSNTITGLTNNTTYYVRAYATNSQGTNYGSEISFKTTIAITLASLTTTAPAGITISSAVLGGQITNDGNALVTERGICYSTTAAPTINSIKVPVGSGTGTFSATVTGLLTNTTYYVRSYAINSQGTAYGNEVNFRIASPTLTTSAATSIKFNSAILGGEVTSDGNIEVTERGICYATTQTPNVNNIKVVIGSGTGVFSTTVTGLLNSTLYYVRSYAINAVGTSYGTQVSFTTLATSSVPALTTLAANNISQNAATSGGNITSDGGVAVTARGVCFGINQNPTIADNITVDGTGTGQFSSQLTSLLPGTVYYARAYATNSTGTGYGAQVTFTTLKTLPTMTTKAVTNISAMGCVTGGTITSTGGGTISERGVCWGTSPDPTITDNKEVSSSIVSSFNSAIIKALPNITYYIRAYAINEIGVAYGSQVSFTTLNAYSQSFETGLMPSGWSGTWVVNDERALDGGYSLRSMYATSSDITLSITISSPGQISFFYSFNDGAAISLYIDEILISDYLNNSAAWIQSLNNISTGTHTIRWHFTPRNYYGLYGTGYIDNIVITNGSITP